MPAALIFPAKIDLIWNHTHICGFNCATCCVAAKHVTNRRISSPDLSTYLPMDMRPGEDRYAAAQRILQENGEELRLEDKLKVLDHLAGFQTRVDISGGDALITPDGLPLLEACSRKLGKDNVTLTITGMHAKDEDLQRIAGWIAEFNFTFNAASREDAAVCPKGYAEVNLTLAEKMVALGVPARAECPLTRWSVQPEHLERLYERLAGMGAHTLLVMRQFTSGRGRLSPDEIPSREDYIQAIATLRELEARGNGPRVKLQCALKHLEVVAGLAAASEENPCDLGTASYGLMPDGTLLASPWAINEHGRPASDIWVLGNLATTPLATLLASDKAQAFIRRADENKGQCKIFAALNSKRLDAMDRVFDTSDPLYSDRPPAERIVAAE